MPRDKKEKRAAAIWAVIFAQLENRGLFLDVKPQYIADMKQEGIAAISLLLMPE